MAACLLQLVFRSRPAGHIVARRPGLVGETRHKGSFYSSPGGREFHRTVIIHSVRLVIRIGEVLIADLDSAHLGHARRPIQRNVVLVIRAEAGGNGACRAVEHYLFRAGGVRTLLQRDLRQQADGRGLNPGGAVRGFFCMDILFIAFDLDLVLGRCHSFCRGVLELFHDHHIVVIDAVGHIDETVIGSRVIFVFCNRMVLIIYGIIKIPCLMTKRYNTPFFIRCAR